MENNLVRKLQRGFGVGVLSLAGLVNCGDTYNTTKEHYYPGVESGDATCRDAVEHMVYVCKDHKEFRFESLVADCQNEPWKQEDVNCKVYHCEDEGICNK